MTRDENWDGKVYKVFIRSTQIRSAEGRLQQQQRQQHGVGDAAFSFRSPVTDHGGELGIERIKQLYFDANATWPLHIWEPLHKTWAAGRIRQAQLVTSSLAWYFQELKQLIMKVLGSITPAAFHMRMSILITKDSCCHSISEPACRWLRNCCTTLINKRKLKSWRAAARFFFFFLFLFFLCFPSCRVDSCWTLN